MRFFLAAVVLLLAFSVYARVYSPRIISDDIADLSGDWANFMQYKDFRGKTEQDLAIAIQQYLVDTLKGFIHYGSVSDIEPGKSVYNNSYDFWHLREPVKMLNTRGFGYCALMSHINSAIYTCVGFNGTRIVAGPAYDHAHVTSELRYGNTWHQYDCNLKGFVMEPGTNRVVRTPEISLHTNWIDYTVTQGYNVYPAPSDRNLVKSAVTDTTVTQYEFRRFQLGHTMDYILRRGEELTCYFRADSTRYLNFYEWWNPQIYIANRILANPDKMLEHDKQTSAAGSGHHYKRPGNVHWHYAPNLTLGYGDYQDGYWADNGVSQALAGIQAQTTNGFSIFEVKTPWPIVGKNGTAQANLANLTGITDGAVARFRTSGGQSVRVYTAYKYPNADSIAWGSPVYTAATDGDHTVDFTMKVYGTYGYLIKFEFAAPGAVLESLTLDTWGQVWPASLPMALTSATTMTYTHRDVAGFQTVPGVVFYDTVPASPIHIKPPRGSKIKWFSAGASFNMRSRAAVILYSLDGQIFDTLWSKVRSITDNFETSHWMLQYDSVKVFDQPVSEVWVRMIEPNPGAYGFRSARVYWHYEEYDRPFTNDQVAYAYSDANYSYGGVTLVSQQTLSDQGETFSVAGSPPGIRKPYSISLGIPSQFTGIEDRLCFGNAMELCVFPNPFNPKVTISRKQQGSENQDVSVRIFDMHGRLVDLFASCSRILSSGITWDASRQPSGIYVAQVKVGGRVLTKSLVLSR
ncbi:MAG: hypothetical protein A2268_11380 [Candidatus Raymondbacteria bacterium RifOxyA12_full_50_37]|uniref:Secretion system C-terminal sorting domain-containing protein n=1 Tax=Candidatus Raymondbacteria bacterium RIFOXYD12_FULL_49_13 TaxID=1817890 RepID=A0A1F7FAC6_UNCRA|nr:MAG: hypothetical protein A2268_11380 [Candidatus Raymondbacteria bacterium RifOxyA12_full_50_37]OGJ92370.1 MAG: hypothetical protein A2248_10505 [Candidatus Raymondbacteria bacterium RIFOXYA2_FULL_49_16]OGJ99351.1 MAG: hypothetical protein A2453_13565 [Candidatus Raymondbacteria bacterium RIFOXYC2_FULL_50_21]OGK02672.1 MAG: hypothetical protein A2487_00935 [Candidatus Raymondbacteria bacterium RifOxyC12_full_50_8]OGK03634.1 MAG: hypothetical protein A2519_02560 [Candidatus Raymondbacteria b